MTHEKLPDGLQLAVNALVWHSVGCDGYKVEIDAIRAEHDQRVTLQHHAADLAQRVADLEAERDRLQHDHHQGGSMSAHTNSAELQRRIAELMIERDIARGAVHELEKKVFGQEHALNVLRACVDRHQRDAADPPGYLQDAVIRAAGLGALHTERDAAIKERNELRARLADLERQEPVAWKRADWSGSESPTLQFDLPPDRPTVRDELTNPIWTPLYARPAHAIPADPGMLAVGMAPSSAYAMGWNDCRAKAMAARPAPAIPAGWKLVPLEPTPEMIAAGRDVKRRRLLAAVEAVSAGKRHDSMTQAMAVNEEWSAMLAAAPEAAR